VEFTDYNAISAVFNVEVKLSRKR